MATNNKIWRYLGGVLGPFGDGMVKVIDGDDYLLRGGDTATGPITATRFISNQATGVPPFDVASTTVVPNLTATNLGAAGQDAAYFRNATNLNAGTISNTLLPTAISRTTLTASGAVTGATLVSTVATGTAPLAVTSQTVVPNLNASLLDGKAATDFLQLTGGAATLAGGLTVNGGIATVGNANLVLGPHGGGQGGQITYKGDGANIDWHTDVFNATHRVIAAGNVVSTLSATSALWPTNTEFVLGASVGADPSWRFHWNGSDHYMDVIGGTTHAMYIRPNGTTRVHINNANSFFFSSERPSDATGLRVGAAWGLQGIYAEIGAVVVGGAGGTNLQNGVLTAGTDGYARTRGHRIFHGAMGNAVNVAFNASGVATIAHGLGVSPISVVVSGASAFDDATGVNGVTVQDWDATNIYVKAMKVSNGAFAVSPRTLTIRWMAGLY